MYLGNPNLRHENEKIELDEEKLDEYIKCKEDVFYFAENYFKIVSVSDGEIIIKLHEFQKRMLKAFVNDENDPRKSCVVKASRQVGKCVLGETLIDVKDNKTGEIKKMKIEDLFNG
jgi:hypothetical protein